MTPAFPEAGMPGLDRLRLRHEEAYGLAEALRPRHPEAAQELDAYCLGLSTALHDLDPPEQAPPAAAAPPPAPAPTKAAPPPPPPPAAPAAAKAPPAAPAEETHYTPERRALIATLWGDLWFQARLPSSTLLHFGHVTASERSVHVETVRSIGFGVR